MIPENFEQFRTALLEDLHRATFSSMVKVFAGTMDEQCFIHETFGKIQALPMWLNSLNYSELRDQMMTRIGLDVLKFELAGGREFHLWIYQVPTSNHTIKYATHYVF